MSRVVESLPFALRFTSEDVEVREQRRKRAKDGAAQKNAEAQLSNVFALTMQDPYAEQEATFSDFWTLWPRRVARKDSERAWEKLTAAQQMAALIAAAEWRRVWLDRGDMQYVPYAASWLRGERWDDELPPEYRKRAHQPMKRDDAVKTQMPEYVRQMIATLKAGK